MALLEHWPLSIDRAPSYFRSIFPVSLKSSAVLFSAIEAFVGAVWHTPDGLTGTDPWPPGLVTWHWSVGTTPQMLTYKTLHMAKTSYSQVSVIIVSSIDNLHVWAFEMMFVPIKDGSSFIMITQQNNSGVYFPHHPFFSLYWEWGQGILNWEVWSLYIKSGLRWAPHTF